MLVPYLDSVSNHNRQITASNASVHIHSHPLLVGCYTPAGHRIYSVAARSANTFEGYAKMPPLCRDVTNRCTLIISRAVVKRHNS